jgi:aminoglycoside phosphotransferase family enzyme/predicted kinase
MAAPSSAPAPPFLAETHLSTIFGVADRVYKLKKPLTLPFVDQSTRAARELLCHHEVARNRRLAPDVYLGVADVIGTDGAVCDHLVVMERMPAERRLSALVVAGDPSVRRALEDLAGAVAAFHRSADRSPAVQRGGDRAWLAHRWEANAQEMSRFDGTILPRGLVSATLGRALSYLEGREPLLARRRAEGWVCDGHGDLMADDIFVLPDGPRALDCVEFDDRLCHGDVVADVACLAMDLERLGAADLAERWISAYEHESGTTVPRSLLHLHVAYRAQVRAKVAAIRAEQLGAGQAGATGSRGEARIASALLELCDRHLRRSTVRLVLVGGAPGTGKSTLAAALGERFGWQPIRSDVVRKRLAGLPATASAASSFEEGIYRPEATDATYEAMLAEASQCLAQGESVIVDASFTRESHRELARRCAEAASAEVLELRCTLDPAESARRVGARREAGSDASDADASVALRLASEADPWPQAIDVPTDAPPREVADRAAALVDAHGWPSPDRAGGAPPARTSSDGAGADPVDRLDATDCRRLLSLHGVGRVAVTSAALPTVLPVAYHLVGESLVLRLPTGDLTGTIPDNTVIAFEADELDPASGAGWSVHLTGIARHPGPREDVHAGITTVMMDTRAVTGRRTSLPVGL